MQNADHPVLRDIVLVGGGHSHVGVLKRFGMKPEPGVRLTVICTDVHTPYSGMLPGYVAGHYSHDEVHIDLSRLAVYAGARLFRDEVVGIDRDAGRVLCRHRPPVLYDRLSINIGSTPQLAGVPGAVTLATPVKPITQFNGRWLALLDRVQRHASGRLRVAVVGAGAGGVELLLAMQYRLRRELQALGRDPEMLEFHLVCAGSTVLPTHHVGVRQRFDRLLAVRGVHVHLDARVLAVEPGELQCANGLTVPFDDVMWVTQAGGAAWLQETGLALDGHGFIRVNDQLQTLTDPHVFAAGDVAALAHPWVEKAGVFAVRQGKTLADNLRASVQGKALKSYRPQRHWLALISTGGEHAVASRGAIGFDGAWVWRWKDWIDRRFMRQFSEFPPLMAEPAAGAGSAASHLALTSEESLQAMSAIAMRCGGCGAKVGSTVLSRALGSLAVVPRDDVLIGLHSPDDAAIVRVPAGKAMVHTVDFFRSFMDDPYLFGKVAANHALGDIFAMGGEAQSATAIATVPPGLESKVEDMLHQMMAGAVEVLNEAGCALVGGHTGEGRELALGFAVNGLIDDHLDGVMRKAGMKPGEVLILTKPLGTGTLFAAQARNAARGRWIDRAIQSMMVSNRQGAQCLQAHGATACTDLTGFGLLGHTVEMTKASGVDVEINLDQLPLLDGALETVALGMVSSLQPANLRLRRAIQNQTDSAGHPRYPLIFDPQTAGGLLASVPAEQAQACLQVLKALGYAQASIIGRTLPPGVDIEPIKLTWTAGPKL